MFGLELIEDRYAQGLEWFEIMSGIYAADAPFDYDGKFYKAKAISGKPRPMQKPRPITLNAAFSPPGREFAAKAADCLFTTFTEIEKGREHIDDMKKRAAVEKREVGVYTTCHVVCRPTQADKASLDHYVKQKQTFSGSHDEEAYRLHRKRFAAGAGTYPLVGTPAHIADQMVKISRAGFAGTTVSFVNFKNELPYFIDNVFPLLREAGLRG
jgi:FMNH2-dependent dimethyl sulfone monooxygenase